MRPSLRAAYSVQFLPFLLCMQFYSISYSVVRHVLHYAAFGDALVLFPIFVPNFCVYSVDVSNLFHNIFILHYFALPLLCFFAGSIFFALPIIK